jgi:phage gp46-like protein
MVPAMYFDLAIAWDPARRCCDLVVDGADLAIDTTPVTPLLISLGSDQRAEPDDVLPDTVTEGSIAAGLNPRRGWAGDALDPNGNRVGARLWLLQREKQTGDVLNRAQRYAEQALAWLAQREGADITVAASWPTRTGLLLQVQLGQTQVSLQVPT